MSTPSTAQKITRILVPYDFSEGARIALDHAIEHARQTGGWLTLLHLIHIPYLGSGFGPGEGLAVEGRLVAELSAQLTDIADEVNRGGVDCTSIVRVGHPASEIVDFARRENTDLIIMGTHGRTGLGHVLLGSVAERVVRQAPCSVLVVRERVRTAA
jgi:universal stress protein A